MEWERCLQSFNREDRIYPLERGLGQQQHLYSFMKNIKKSGTLSL